jgi:hypothetical protein
MEKYYFFVNVFESDPLTTNINKYIGQKKVIKYKCIICGYEHEWDDTWMDEKKAEVKAEVDKHHNEHIIPSETTDNI